MNVHIISSIKDDDNIKIHTFLQHVNMLLREYLKAIFAWYTKYSCEKSKGLISSMPFQEHVVFVVLVRRYWFVFIGIRFIKSVSCMWNLLALDFYDILKILKTFLLKWRNFSCKIDVIIIKNVQNIHIQVFSIMNFGLNTECKMKNMKALGEEKNFH